MNAEEAEALFVKAMLAIERSTFSGKKGVWVCVETELPTGMVGLNLN